MPGLRTHPRCDLIPIRLELTVNGELVTEYFTWSIDETNVTPAEFAAVLVSDLGLPPQSSASISASISDQIGSFREEHGVSDSRDAGAMHQELNQPSSESRHIIKLNVRVGGLVLKDQFEWDVCNQENSPEAFAEILSADLGLGREFVPAIAHNLRDQLALVSASKRRRTSCGVLNSRTAIRPASSVQAFEPLVEYLSRTQQDNLAKKEKREARLADRKRRGVTDRPDRAAGHRRRSTLEIG